MPHMKKDPFTSSTLKFNLETNQLDINQKKRLASKNNINSSQVTAHFPPMDNHTNKSGWSGLNRLPGSSLMQTFPQPNQ